jgi:hypothetical protein
MRGSFPVLFAFAVGLPACAPESPPAAGGQATTALSQPRPPRARRLDVVRGDVTAAVVGRVTARRTILSHYLRHAEATRMDELDVSVERGLGGPAPAATLRVTYPRTRERADVGDRLALLLARRGDEWFSVSGGHVRDDDTVPFFDLGLDELDGRLR